MDGTLDGTAGVAMDILAFRSRPLAAEDRASAADVLKAAGIGAVAGTAVSGAFHRFGPPKMGLGAPWVAATLGVGLMTGLAAGALTATHRTGDRTNSMLGSALIGTTAFAIPGIWIHGKMDFTGKPVNRWLAAAGVAMVGAIVSPLIHEATRPRDWDSFRRAEAQPVELQRVSGDMVRRIEAATRATRALA